MPDPQDPEKCHKLRKDEFMKVVVLGATGMLGSMVYSYLKSNPKLSVVGTTRSEFDASEFVSSGRGKDLISGDYVINCIGIIKPFCKDNDPAGVVRAITVNGLFPHRLAQSARERDVRVIQIATDCVYSGVKGAYQETDAHDALDVYGKSKSLGEAFDKGLLNIRCSIIGPEPKSKVSLLEWFLNSADGSELNGFTHHRWNGVTTLQFAKLCEAIVLAPKMYENLLEISHLHHFVPNTTVNKYELLQQMASVFKKNVQIKAVNNVGAPVDRTLSTQHKKLAEIYPSGIQMESALKELRDYMQK